MGKTKITMAILVLALALFFPFAIQAQPPSTQQGQHLKITEVFVDVPPGQITINGTELNFGPGPLVVTLGNFGRLENCKGDETQIVCDLPKKILKGDYLLTVSMGIAPSSNDEYDLTVYSDLAPACFDAYYWSSTEDGEGFLADCISSAGCPDAERNCTIAAEDDYCTPCIFKGEACEMCNGFLAFKIECTDICGDPYP